MDIEKLDRLYKMMKNSKSTMVLTGAGMSTESGIPDFRSPKTGLWENMDPMEALSTEVLYNNPRKFYKEGYSILLSMKNAQPNKGHYALMQMEEMGYIDGVITQNIDNLHHKAGSKYILEVHGQTRTGSCMNCGEKVELDVITDKVNKGQIPPLCDLCGGELRPDVVFFGDQLPEDFTTAWEKVKKCDLLIVIGSSLTVAPVNYLLQIAEKVAIINVGQTTFDRYADVVINGKCGITLVELLNIFKQANQNGIL